MLRSAVATIIIICSILGIGMLYSNYRVEMALSEQGRAELAKNFMGACAARQKNSAINREMGITAHQIGAYCRCYAESLAALATMEERRYFALNESAPSGFEAKVQQAAETCFPVIEEVPD
jgi:hypothetical protein